MSPRTSFAAAVAMTIAACTAAQAPADIDELIEHNVAAGGGRDAIEAVEAIEYRLRIDEPTFAVEAIYRADRDGRMRIDVFDEGERVYSEGLDGRRGWEMGRLATEGEPISAAAEAILRQGLQSPGQLYGLHEMRGFGHTLELAGQETVDGIRYHVIELTYAGGETTVRYYINPQTWLIERKREVRPLHPEVLPEPVHLETRWSDCRPVDGVVHCLQEETTNLDTGEWMQRVRVIQIVHDPELPADLFAVPTASPSP